MVHNHHYSPYKRYYPKAQGPNTVLPSNKKAPPLEGGNSIEIGGMWTLKNEIRPPKYYELLIKKDIKGYTSLDLNNF